MSLDDLSDLRLIAANPAYQGLSIARLPGLMAGMAASSGGKAAAAGATTAPLPLLNAPEAAEKGEERLRATT